MVDCLLLTLIVGVSVQAIQFRGAEYEVYLGDTNGGVCFYPAVDRSGGAELFDYFSRRSVPLNVDLIVDENIYNTTLTQYSEIYRC